MTTKILALTAALMSITGVAYGSGTNGGGADQPNITSRSAFLEALAQDRLVKRDQVTFKNGQVDMAGVLYMPANMAAGKTYPAVVVVHPAGGTKEQTSGLYAYRLAQSGYVALAFDASHQGESGGQPRLLEDPTTRVEDVKSAVDYFLSLSFVDGQRIGALGICAGGGYAVNATMSDYRIQAVAGVSAFNMGDGFRKGWTGSGSVEEQRATLRGIAEQRTAELNGAEQALLPYVPDSPEGVTEPEMVEASNYYRLADRWQVPTSPNRFIGRSMGRIYAFDAFNGLDSLLDQPLLLVVGSNAGTRWHSDRAYALATGPKNLVVVPGATHMSLYDRDVSKAMPALLQFFGQHLAARTD
jgi:fermentation-respiration switch protein FrsA (DUF1100 family)